MEIINPSATIERVGGGEFTRADGDEIIKHIERAGRTCYKSEDKITADSAEKFVRSIRKRGHHSVLEHGTLTVRFVCDRGITHELVRHRLAAYSQESTRYCNYKGGVVFILPPWVSLQPGEYDDDAMSQITILEMERRKKLLAGTTDYTDPDFEWARSMFDAEWRYKALLNAGWSPQQARDILPNSLKTEIVMTCNLREWMHVLTLRGSKAAHPQMRELIALLSVELKKVLPVIFEEIDCYDENGDLIEGE